METASGVSWTHPVCRELEYIFAWIATTTSPDDLSDLIYALAGAVTAAGDRTNELPLRILE